MGTGATFVARVFCSPGDLPARILSAVIRAEAVVIYARSLFATTYLWAGTVLQFMRTTMTKTTIASRPRTIETIAAKRETSLKGRPHRRCGPENLGIPGAFIASRIQIPESRGGGSIRASALRKSYYAMIVRDKDQAVRRHDNNALCLPGRVSRWRRGADTTRSSLQRRMHHPLNIYNSAEAVIVDISFAGNGT